MNQTRKQKVKSLWNAQDTNEELAIKIAERFGEDIVMARREAIAFLATEGSLGKVKLEETDNTVEQTYTYLRNKGYTPRDGAYLLVKGYEFTFMEALAKIDELERVLKSKKP